MKQCPKCGMIFEDTDIICPKCGMLLDSQKGFGSGMPVPQSSSQYYRPPFYAPNPVSNGLAVASMVLGIASMPLLLFCGVGIVTAIIAVVFGFVALRSIKASNGAQQGSGMAIAGIVCGFSAIALLLLYILIITLTGVASYLSSRG
ncbi:MAG: DUF4190 domain-containing protein [Clostridia bacterium]|nr:DUF4190 domain-containing protein [Clostridia bacterium]